MLQIATGGELSSAAYVNNNNNDGDEKGEEEVLSCEDPFLAAARSKKWKVSGKKKYLKEFYQQIDHRTLEKARLMPRADDPADYMTLVDMLRDSWAKNEVFNIRYL